MAGMQNIREGLTGNLTKLIVIAIVITFVGSIGWAGFFSQGNANTIAKIGSKQITSADLNFEIASQQFLLNQRFPDQQIEDEVLVELSIESLIRKFGILNFLEDNNFSLPDSFVFTELAKEEQFEENGKFSKQNFDAFARSNGFIPQDYLNRIKEDLALEFWKQALVKSSFLSRDDIQQSYNLAEQERDITFARLPIIKFSEEAESSEENLLEFYNSNINEYFTEQKTRLNYILLSLDNLKPSIIIDEADIEAEYKIYLDEFDETERKSVSHIMLNIDSDRSKEDALGVLEETKTRLANGENFSSLALEISDDTGTKDSGGSLGVTDGTLLPPEFEEALYEMDEGQVYGPIELNSSVHLIKLTKREIPEPKTLQSMQTQIKDNLVDEAALLNYSTLLDQASDLVFSAGSLGVIEDELGIEIIDSGLFSLNEVSDDLNKPSVIKLIFDKNLDDSFVELIEISDNQAIIFERITFEDARVIDFDSIKGKVSEDYKTMATDKAASDFVKKTLNDLNEGLAFETLASNSGFTLETYKRLKRDSSLLTSEAIAKIFSLPRSKAGSVYEASVSNNGDYLIYRLDSVQNNDVQMNQETEKAFSEYLIDQRVLAEYSELLFATQENSAVTRTN